MHIEIRSRGFVLTDGIRAHTERRLSFALDRFSQEVRTVLVWVWDVNGHKGGGDDKHCRIAVQLRRGTVMLEERAADLYVAIDRAVHAASQTIARDGERVCRPTRLRRRAVEFPPGL